MSRLDKITTNITKHNVRVCSQVLVEVELANVFIEDDICTGRSCNACIYCDDSGSTQTHLIKLAKVIKEINHE